MPKEGIAQSCRNRNDVRSERDSVEVQKVFEAVRGFPPDQWYACNVDLADCIGDKDVPGDPMSPDFTPPGKGTHISYVLKNRCAEPVEDASFIFEITLDLRTRRVTDLTLFAPQKGQDDDPQYQGPAVYKLFAEISSSIENLAEAPSLDRVSIRRPRARN